MSKYSMNHLYAPQHERAYGYQNEDDVMRKQQTKVVVAGLGGGGGQLAVSLASEGYGSISIIDGDSYDQSNWRVPYVGENEVGRPKNEVTAEQILNQNPDVNLKVYDGFLTPDNVDDFIMDETKRDQRVIVVDEIDVKGQGPAAALHLAQTARRYGYPVTSVTDIGKGGGFVTSYDPNSKYTYERVNKLPSDVTYETMTTEYEGGLPLLPYIPPYGSFSTLNTLTQHEDVSVPSTPRSVLAATALGLSEIERLTLDYRGSKSPKPTWSPRVRWMDVDYATHHTRYPRASSVRFLAIAAIREKILGVNAPASYSYEDVQRRAAERNKAL